MIRFLSAKENLMAFMTHSWGRPEKRIRHEGSSSGWVSRSHTSRQEGCLVQLSQFIYTTTSHHTYSLIHGSDQMFLSIAGSLQAEMWVSEWVWYNAAFKTISDRYWPMWRIEPWSSAWRVKPHVKVGYLWPKLRGQYFADSSVLA